MGIFFLISLWASLFRYQLWMEDGSPPPFKREVDLFKESHSKEEVIIKEHFKKHLLKALLLSGSFFPEEPSSVQVHHVLPWLSHMKKDILKDIVSKGSPNIHFNWHLFPKKEAISSSMIVKGEDLPFLIPSGKTVDEEALLGMKNLFETREEATFLGLKGELLHLKEKGHLLISIWFLVPPFEKPFSQETGEVAFTSQVLEKKSILKIGLTMDLKTDVDHIQTEFGLLEHLGEEGLLQAPERVPALSGHVTKWGLKNFVPIKVHIPKLSLDIHTRRSDGVSSFVKPSIKLGALHIPLLKIHVASVDKELEREINAMLTKEEEGAKKKLKDTLTSERLLQEVGNIWLKGGKDA